MKSMNVRHFSIGCLKLFCRRFLHHACCALALFLPGLGNQVAGAADSSVASHFHLAAAPAVEGLALHQGDRLAICGDSITEQRMYSRIIETYLTVALPQLQIETRQFGWSGERAGGFLARMTNDCLRFRPTIATTCYGMNDHEYRPYEDRIGQVYESDSDRIIKSFKANGVRVIHGSPGPVGKMPGWVKSASGTVDDLNMNLAHLRNIGIDLANREKVGFADVFPPMIQAVPVASERYGDGFAVAGKDGVHPGWAGHTIMAYAFLKALGVDGDIGTFTVNAKSNEAEVSRGHELISFRNGELKIKSSQFPFCASGETNNDNSIRAGMTLVPFNRELNRLIFVFRNGAAAGYRITWGGATRQFSGRDLGRGINLAEEFPVNPFSDAFKAVDDAVAAKQAYETRQIKDLFHGLEGRADREATANLTEKVRRALADKIKSAFAPVIHTIKIEAE